MFALARRALGTVGFLASALGLAACAGPGKFVWFDQLPAQVGSTSEYVIAVGDTVDVRVLGHDEMNVHQKVRPDGRIALPIIGEVEARGTRPSSLRAELEGRLKDYIVSPSVTVNVDETQPMTIVVLGEVQRPGAYTIQPNSGLAQALAMGGGLTDYASRDRIFVVREQPNHVRIRFTYESVSRDDGHAAEFPLHSGDLIVVE